MSVTDLESDQRLLYGVHLGIEFYLFVSHGGMNYRGSTCKFRNSRSAFRNLHVDPLSLFVVTPSHVASWKIECQIFSYVYRSRKHWKCKYMIIERIGFESRLLRSCVICLLHFSDRMFCKHTSHFLVQLAKMGIKMQSRISQTIY